MGADAAPLARLRRALDRGSLVRAEAAAHECADLDCTDALALSLLMLRERDDRFQAAATRWLGRLLVAHPSVGLESAGEAAQALRELSGPYENVARARLALILRRVGETRAAELLQRSAR